MVDVEEASNAAANLPEECPTQHQRLPLCYQQSTYHDFYDSP